VSNIVSDLNFIWIRGVGSDCVAPAAGAVRDVGQGLREGVGVTGVGGGG
jgi:hypothetical protein